MSRPAHSTPAADAARSSLLADDVPGFDRLAAAVLSSSALGPALRRVLPGPAGFRWLHGEGVAPTARPASLTPEQWLSLHRCATTSGPLPTAGSPGARDAARRPSDGHGHAPGAKAVPRWF